MKRYAIPPTGCMPYLTAGKRYEVNEETATAFHVRADNDSEVFCLKKRCFHACFGNWTLVDAADDAPVSTPRPAPVIDNGGPAFPRVCGIVQATGEIQTTSGMSLRDWFAGMALNGIVDCAEWTKEHADEHATYAYRCADAILAQRGKPTA